jgi:tetratricopeptide (TPR) repeat protein
VRLTAKERILIHLADYTKYAQTAEVPANMGQEGIARAAGIYVQHLRQFINPLIKDGMVRERIAHVAGHRRRLRVYDLTDSGRMAAARLRGQVRAKPIRVRDAAGIKETTVGDALRETGGGATLVDIVREAGERDIVDLPSLQPVKGAAFVARLTEAPGLRTFVGRTKELQALTHEGEGPRLFFVHGVAGIGKSSLAAKACERLRGSRNLYWHRVRSWDTRLAILAGLADFLANLGRPGLRVVLARGDEETADHVVQEDLQGTRTVLVFDDAHDAAPEVLRFLRFLKDVLAGAPDLSMIVLSRRTLPIYDRRDVAIHGLVQEIDLRGLGAEDIAVLVGGDPGSSRLQNAARKFGGHPLILELMRSTAQRGPSTESLTDVQRFVEEEIYSELTEPERRMMKTAALYEVPIPREALLADAALSHDVLLSLTGKALIRRVGDDAFGVHDTIRDFFVSILTASERGVLAPTASQHLLRLSADAHARRDFVAVLNCLANALRLASSPVEEASLWESVGDTNERMGDFPAALVAYAEARRRLSDPEAVARVHRKTAAALIVRGDIDPAISEIEAGFEVLAERSSVERGWFELLQCRIASFREDWAEARGHGEAALASFHGFRDVHGMALASAELATIETYSPTGDPAEAERYLMSAMESAKAMKDAEFEARVRIALANLFANRIGDVERATRQWREVEAVQEGIGDPHVRRNLLMIKGWFALYQQADFQAAESLFTQAVQLARRIHDPATLAFAEYGLASTLYYDGKPEAAREAFGRFAAEADTQGTPGYAMEARWMIAECSLVLEDLTGFRQMAAGFRNPKFSAGVAARPIHAKVIAALDALLGGDRDRCRTSFAEAFRLAGTYVGTPDAMLIAFLNIFYGIALPGMGEEPRSEEINRKTVRSLEQYGLKAQLLMMRETGPRIVEFLRKTSASPSSAGAESR